MSAPFRVKICGITSLEQAQMVTAAGADAIGLNFFPQSPRFLPEKSREQFASPLAGLYRVGVFVNEAPATIRSICQGCALDAVQLHGDEPPEVVAELHDLTVIRAFHYDAAWSDTIRDYLTACAALAAMPQAALIDSGSSGLYGGSGQVIDWVGLRQTRNCLGDMPLVLSGGLNPENVQIAIDIVNPAAVDAASGVEQSPGHKDQSLVTRFCAAAAEALDRLA